MWNNGKQTTSSSSSSPLDLKMQLQPTALYHSDGDAPIFNTSSNHPHFYEPFLLQRTPDYSASTSSGGINMNMMGVCGKAVFTSSQLQELERQKMIHKYILASIPVPPQLLFLSTSTPPPPSQCNCNLSLSLSLSILVIITYISWCGVWLAAGVDLRSGSDPEPWRCKRTDGKKWRCSRDVAPDQKYCERHAHKNRPRSRKHVENSNPPHSYSNKPFTHHPSTLPRSTPYHQTRCIEWLTRGGNSDDTSARKHHQWEQQLMHMSSSSSINKINDNHHNLSVYHPHFGEKQGLMSGAIQTRLFIDGWGKEGIEGDGKEAAEKKLWPLSLSMCGDDYEKGKESEWVNNNLVSWNNSSPPGGPLGEALCLGNANTSRIGGGGGGSGGWFLASVHGHGCSNSKPNSSSCSKGSCEDGSHALNFIG